MDVPKPRTRPAPPPRPPAGRYREQYGIIALCNHARHQEQVYNQLKKRGLKCRVVCCNRSGQKLLMALARSKEGVRCQG